MDKDKFFKAVLQGKDEEVGEMIANVVVDHDGSSYGYVTAQDEDGNTALHWAARQAFFRMARLLLSLGAKVNATNHAGQTPLHLAAFMDRIQMGCLLIDHGADLRALDKNGRKPISKQVAATERLASTFIKHKKEQDAWAQQNEQLIAILGHKNRLKLETLLQDSHEKLSAEMEQQKMEILESSQQESGALQTIQATTDTLQGRMDDFEQQQQQQQHGSRTALAAGGENQDPQVSSSAGPPKKRRLKMIATTMATSTTRTSRRGADASSRLAVCEAQIKEQAVEIAALRAMILGEAATEIATSAFASAVPMTSTTTRMLKTSSSSTSPHPNSFGGSSKVKMEPGVEHAAKVAASTGSDTHTTAMSGKTNNDATALLSLSLESTKLELQRVQAELQTTKESENRYKSKCEYYEGRMEQEQLNN